MFDISLLLALLFLYDDGVECVSAFERYPVFLTIAFIKNEKWVYVLKPIEPP